MSWIAIALSADVPSGTVVPACLDGTDLAIWRGASGTARAFGDRCPHRGMRLSHGFVRGERLACIYHGWQYGAEGGCRYIPAHPGLAPPSSISAARHACTEAGGAIWVDMAEEPGAGGPPDIGGRRPIRSLGAACSAEAARARLGQGSIAVIGGPEDIAVAIQPAGPGACVIHGWAREGGDPRAASRALEALRGELEDA